MPQPQGQLDIFSIEQTPRDDPWNPPPFHSVILDIMRCRGITSREEIVRYGSPDYERDTHDPFLFEDMRVCVDRITRALNAGEKICIYGDYDVDGICATVILYETLIKQGGYVVVRINHRDDEGYGIHAHAIDELAKDGVSLLITTDQGISNKEELDRAGLLGIDVIITDHHTVPDDPALIPSVIGIIHPRVHADRYPFKDLSGGGAAFKLVQGVIRSYSPQATEWNYHEKWLLDLVCLSTLADCVPLVGENRTFLHFGLMVMNKQRRIGIRALLSVVPAHVTAITTHTILFYVSPLLNAASRMDHAQSAFDLLIEKKLARAQEIAHVLAGYNKERQKLTIRITREASAQCKMRRPENRILVGSSPGWPLGVLGLVAGTLVRTFKKPVVLISEKADKGIGVARSTSEIHITRTFQKINDLFDRYGGHHHAGGFALKKGIRTDDFANRINAIVHDDFSAPAPDSNDEKSYDLELGDISFEFACQLKQCQPWGQGNPEPTFRISNCTILTVARVGKKLQHLRLIVQHGEMCRTLLGIRKGARADELAVGDVLTIYCHIDIGQWRGVQDIFIEIIDYSKQSL